MLLSIFVVPVETGTITVFLVGAILLIIGMGFFTLGADISMMPVGEGIGIQFSKSKNIKIIALLTFFIGVIITIAKPDLQVLVKQVPSIPDMLLILTVAVGVGVFLLMATLRIFFKWKLSSMDYYFL